MTEKVYAALLLYIYKSPCKTAECSNTGTVLHFNVKLFCRLLRSGIPCVDLSLLLIDHGFIIRVREEGSVMLTLASGVRCADRLCAVRIVDNDSGALL